MVVSAEVCCEEYSLLIKDPDGLVIDFPELFATLVQKHRKAVLEDGADHVSMSSVGVIYKTEESGDSYFSFTILFWQRISEGEFSDNELIYDCTLEMGIHFLDKLKVAGQDDPLWHNVAFLEDIHMAFNGEMFVDVNDFMTEVMDGVNFTNLEAQIITSSRIGKIALEHGGFRLVEIIPILVTIHFDFKYQTIATRKEIRSYVIVDIPSFSP